MDEAAESLMVIACADMLERTGVREIKVSYDDREEPTTWTAVGRWEVLWADGPKTHWQSAGGMTPDQAVLRLVKQTCDGQECTWCARPVIIETLSPATRFENFCHYVLDSEAQIFRRGCEKAP